MMKSHVCSNENSSPRGTWIVCVGGCVQYQQCVHFILQRKKEEGKQTAMMLH